MSNTMYVTAVNYTSGTITVSSNTHTVVNNTNWTAPRNGWYTYKPKFVNEHYQPYKEFVRKDRKNSIVYLCNEIADGSGRYTMYEKNHQERWVQITVKKFKRRYGSRDEAFNDKLDELLA